MVLPSSQRKKSSALEYKIVRDIISFCFSLSRRSPVAREIFNTDFCIPFVPGAGEMCLFLFGEGYKIFELGSLRLPILLKG